MTHATRLCLLWCAVAVYRCGPVPPEVSPGSSFGAADQTTSSTEDAISGSFEANQISLILSLGVSTLPFMFRKPALQAPYEASPGANGWEPGASPITTGNAITFIIDGDNYKSTLLSYIGGAQSSIWINVFEWQTESTATEIANALIAAVRDRGVSVHVVVDNRQRSGDFSASPVPSQALMQQMSSAGIEVLGVEYSGFRVNHRKVMIFDGTTAMVMGGNIGGNYLLPLSAGWTYHDGGILISGPAVADVANVFLDSYNRAGGSDLKAPKAPDPQTGAYTDARVQMLMHSAGQDRNIEREIVQRIDAARDRVVLANGFGMSHTIRDAMIRAARRGVRATWLWGVASDQTTLMAQVSFDVLREAGVDVRHYGHPLHMKAYLADDTLIIGSSNLDGFSCWLNDESSLQIQSAQLANDFYNQVFAADINGAIVQFGDAKRPSGIRERLIGSVLEPLID